MTLVLLVLILVAIVYFEWVASEGVKKLTQRLDSIESELRSLRDLVKLQKL
jgi:hypothetical protein